jgi:hypothetical protein
MKTSSSYWNGQKKSLRNQKTHIILQDLQGPKNGVGRLLKRHELKEGQTAL